MPIFPGNYFLTVILSLAHGLILVSTASRLNKKPLENLMLNCPKTGDLIKLGNLACGFIAISINLLDLWMYEIGGPRQQKQFQTYGSCRGQSRLDCHYAVWLRAFLSFITWKSQIVHRRPHQWISPSIYGRASSDSPAQWIPRT